MASWGQQRPQGLEAQPPRAAPLLTPVPNPRLSPAIDPGGPHAPPWGRIELHRRRTTWGECWEGPELRSCWPDGAGRPPPPVHRCIHHSEALYTSSLFSHRLHCVGVMRRIPGLQTLSSPEDGAGLTSPVSHRGPAFLLSSPTQEPCRATSSGQQKCLSVRTPQGI